MKITGYTCIYNILKSPNKTQNGRNKDLLCECGYLWFKIHNLMLSDQMKLSYMLITKENYMLNHMKLLLYRLQKRLNVSSPTWLNLIKKIHSNLKFREHYTYE